MHAKSDGWRGTKTLKNAKYLIGWRSQKTSELHAKSDGWNNRKQRNYAKSYGWNCLKHWSVQNLMVEDY